uniref:Thermopsin n=1 Tax=Gongylonema pulchrum TaxID=637853 RepID=A0A183D2T3_9BILA
LQVLRFGGYGSQGSGLTGSYLDLDVSWTQFVTGRTPFYVPSDNNHVTIIGDEEASTTTTLDYKYSLFAPMPYLGHVAYYAVASVDQGFHTLRSYGRYTAYVSGNLNNTSYGFLFAYNS